MLKKVALITIAAMMVFSGCEKTAQNVGETSLEITLFSENSDSVMTTILQSESSSAVTEITSQTSQTASQTRAIKTPSDSNVQRLAKSIWNDCLDSAYSKFMIYNNEDYAVHSITAIKYNDIVIIEWELSVSMVSNLYYSNGDIPNVVRNSEWISFVGMYKNANEELVIDFNYLMMSAEGEEFIIHNNRDNTFSEKHFQIYLNGNVFGAEQAKEYDTYEVEAYRATLTPIPESEIETLEIPYENFESYEKLEKFLIESGFFE